MKYSWILYDNERLSRNRQFASFLAEACRRHGVFAEVVLTEELTYAIREGRPVLFRSGKECAVPDFIIRRCVDDAFAGIMELFGIPVCNSRSVSELCNNKMATYAWCVRHSVRAVDSLLLSDPSECGVIPWKAPYVLKPVDDHGGKDVLLARDTDECLTILEGMGRPMICQPYIECGSSDIRVYVLGSNILQAMQRRSSGDFRSNFCLGGTAEKYELSREERSVVLKVASELNADFVGIDFFKTREGFILNEIEDVVGCRMLYSVCSTDAAEVYVDYIISHYADRESVSPAFNPESMIS